MTVYDEIKVERDYQQQRWGNKLDDTVNSPWFWVSYITAYAGKWMVGTFAPLGQTTTDLFRTMMIKVASIAVAAVESLDRQRTEKGKAFYE